MKTIAILLNDQSEHLDTLFLVRGELYNVEMEPVLHRYAQLRSILDAVHAYGVKTHLTPYFTEEYMRELCSDKME